MDFKNTDNHITVNNNMVEIRINHDSINFLKDIFQFLYWHLYSKENTGVTIRVDIRKINKTVSKAFYLNLMNTIYNYIDSPIFHKVIFVTETSVSNYMVSLNKKLEKSLMKTSISNKIEFKDA